MEKIDRTVRVMIDGLTEIERPSPETCEKLRFVGGSQVNHRTQETVEFRNADTGASLLCVKQWIEGKGGRQELDRTWFAKPKDFTNKGMNERKKMTTKPKKNGTKKAANKAAPKKPKTTGPIFGFSTNEIVRWMALNKFTEEAALSICKHFKVTMSAGRCNRQFARAKKGTNPGADLTADQAKKLQALKPKKNGNGKATPKKNGNGKKPAPKKAAAKTNGGGSKPIKPITKESQVGRSRKPKKARQ